MRRREFITLIGGVAAAWPLAVRAQQDERVRRIGMLINFAQTDREGQASVAAFVATLQRLGWVDGRNLRIDYRWSAGESERIKVAAAELVRSAPDAIAVANSPALGLVLKHIGLYVAECGVGLVFDAVVECQDDVFLELLRARMRVHDRFSFPVAVFGIGQSQHIHLDAGRHQSDDGVHVLRDARRRVQSDRCPDRIDVVLVNAVTTQEVAGDVRAVDLEALVGAAVRRG